MRRLENGRRRGWGSLKVDARIGAARWRTSIFPGDNGTWLIPIKRAVREAEALVEDAETEIEIQLSSDRHRLPGKPRAGPSFTMSKSHATKSPGSICAQF